MHVLAILTLLVVSSMGFVIAYMTSQTDSDEAVVVANMNKVISDLLDSFFTVVDTLRSFVQSTVLFLLGNIWTILLLTFFLGFALLVHYESAIVLVTMDRGIRRIIYPATQAVVQSLHVLKFVFGTFAPIYNFLVVVQTQLIQGTATIISKCSARTFISAVHILAGSVVSFFEAVGLFFRGEGVFENDLNITEAVWGVQLAVQEQEKTVSCVCRQLSPFAQLMLSAAKPAAFAQCVNALLNVVVSAVQEPARIFTNSSFPDFNRTYGHTRDALYYGGKYLDEVAITSVSKILEAIQIRLEIQLPEMFLFGVGSHLAIASVRTLYWLQLVLTNMILPRPSKFTDVEFMVNLLSTTPIFVELDRAVEGTGDLIEWTLNTVVRGVKDVYDPLNSDPSNPLPPLMTDEDTRQASKLFKHGMKALLSVPHLLTDGTTTILWRGVISRNQTTVDAFKTYDGFWYDDNSCDARVSRGEDCACDYTASDYRPFCANPTLQADVFYNLEQFLDAFGHFGFQFMRPVAASLKLGMQAVRIVLRGLFYADDIIARDFFHHHRNHKNNPYNGEARCTDVNRPGCEFNPLLPARDAICMYSFPDDLEGVSIYESSDYWCNSMLIEFVLREISALTDVLTDALLFSDPSCSSFNSGELHSDHNIMCAAAEAVQSILDVPLNLFRQLNSELVGFLDAPDGVILHTHFDTMNRFDEVDQALFASVGTLASPFPAPFDETVTRIGYSIVSFPLVALRGAYYATLYARQLILSEQVDWKDYVPDCDECVPSLRTVPSGALGFVYVEVRLVYVWLVETLTSFKAIQPEFFQSFIQIANILMEALSQPFLDVLELILKVAADTLQFFSTGRINAGGFLGDLVTLVKKTLSLLARVSTRILGSILDMLGPLGTFLRTFASGICKTIYAVLCGISAIIGTDSFCDDSDCLSGGLRAKDHPFNHVPKDIAALGWHDDSRCDRLVNAYQDYTWGDLRPIEQIELQECAEQRYIAMSLADSLNVDLPVDMLYNWKRKFEMVYHGSLGAMLYVRHLLGESSVHFKHQWDFWGVPDYWLQIFRMTHSKVQQFEFPTDALVEVLRGETGTDVLVTVLEATNHSVRAAHEVWTNAPSFEWNVSFPEYNLGAGRVMHTLDYAWDIQTDIDFVGRTECTVLDNTIEMFEQQTDFMVHYYNNVYMNVTVPHFLAYLEYDDPWLEDFERVMRDANVTLPDFYDLPPPDTLDTLNANFEACALPPEEETLAYVAKLFECFVTGTGDEKLPYVQHNLEYMLKYQFRTCKQDQISWLPSEIAGRVDRMMESLIACVWVTVGVIVMQRLIAFPIGVFFPLIGLGYAMIFATHVWNYTIRCFPNVPVSLLDDMFAFAERYLIPRCMCEYFPTLTNGCVIPECYFVSQEQMWDVCETKLNVLYGAGEGETYFNMFWSPFMFAREYFPQLLHALHYFPPLYQWDAFSVWMERESIPITPLERDCVQFHYLNNAVILIGGLVSVFFASSVLAAVIKLVLIPIKIIPSLCSLAYSMLVSLDAQTMLPAEKAKPKPVTKLKPIPKKLPENLIIRI